MSKSQEKMIKALGKCIAYSKHADELAQSLEDYFEGMDGAWSKRRQWSPLLNEIIDTMEEASDARIEWDN